MDITKFNSYKELTEHFDMLSIEYDEIEAQVAAVIYNIVTDNSFKNKIKNNATYIKRLEELEGQDLLFGKNRLIEEMVQEYKDYLTKEFYNYGADELYESYCSLGYEHKELQNLLIIFGTIENKLKVLDMPEESVETLIETIFQEYKKQPIKNIIRVR